MLLVWMYHLHLTKAYPTMWLYGCDGTWLVMDDWLRGVQGLVYSSLPDSSSLLRAASS